jgi:hypothetical protein
MSLLERIAYADSILPGTPAPDGEQDPRWSAIIAIGDHIASGPGPIWEFVARWGTHPQDDLRMAIATCLLEHLLQYHFDLVFPRVRALAEANALFADTFSQCWKFGQSKLPENSRKFDAFQAWCLSRRRA